MFVHTALTCPATLLARPVGGVDWAAAAPSVRGRRVLITGAGGSIGGVLATAIARLRPASLVLLDHAEYALWRVAQDLAGPAPDVPIHPVIADIRDTARLARVLGRHRPDLIFHAAALKHVPIVQAHPLEGLLTNTVGTRHLLDAARATACKTVVLVSTDKAVAPASVMGASKRLAERYAQATDHAATQANAHSRCVSLRLGNVLGSAGSVAELFARQIAAGGPLTVTHPDMRRYFITGPEAIDLLLTAARLADAGTLPPGAVLLPRLHSPVRILDLAERMIRAAGLTPGHDIPIRFTGRRAGEKLTERLRDPAEPALATPDPRLAALTPPAPERALLARALDELEAACRAGEERLALAQLSRLIPAFDHCPEGRADRLRA